MQDRGVVVGKARLARGRDHFPQRDLVEGELRPRLRLKQEDALDLAIGEEGQKGQAPRADPERPPVADVQRQRLDGMQAFAAVEADGLVAAPRRQIDRIQGGLCAAEPSRAPPAAPSRSGRRP